MPCAAHRSCEISASDRAAFLKLRTDLRFNKHSSSEISPLARGSGSASAATTDGKMDLVIKYKDRAFEMPIDDMDVKLRQAQCAHTPGISFPHSGHTPLSFNRFSRIRNPRLRMTATPQAGQHVSSQAPTSFGRLPA